MPKGYRLLQKPIIKCETCGISREMRDSYMAKTQKFCSRKCRRHRETTKEQIRQKKTGVPVHSEITKKMFRKRMLGNKYALGHKLSSRHRQTIVNAQTGEKSHFWKDGRCQDIEYINWQKNEWHRRKRNAIGHHTFKEWQSLQKQYGFKCANCFQKIKLTEDHIIPLSKGGMNSIDNIQPLCLKCNMKKHAKLQIKS